MNIPYLGTAASIDGCSGVTEYVCYYMSSSAIISTIAKEPVSARLLIPNGPIILPPFLPPYNQSVRI